jgi:hypothetical protein
MDLRAKKHGARSKGNCGISIVDCESRFALPSLASFFALGALGCALLLSCFLPVRLALRPSRLARGFLLFTVPLAPLLLGSRWLKFEIRNSQFEILAPLLSCCKRSCQSVSQRLQQGITMRFQPVRCFFKIVGKLQW